MLASIGSTLQGLGLILVVIAIFNVIIFIHELGHFLAARWRGLHVDRFQIWFGKPIWKKTVNGVQYGLGWLPFGGFVALPQMAPMESIEGGNTERKEPLPAVKPIDKIIVAFAGPLFSFLLALTAGLVVWKVGKPKDFVETTTVRVAADSPAQKAGLRSGDSIVAVDDEPVTGFAGSLDCIFEKIVLSKNDTLKLTVRREGQAEPFTVVSGFESEKGSLLQRSGLRRIGILPAGPCIVESVSKDGAAEEAGLQKGDVILSVAGTPVHNSALVTRLLEDHEWKATPITYKRGNEIKEAVVEPERPNPPHDKLPPMLGLAWDDESIHNEKMHYPTPWEQVTDSVRMMLATISAVVSPKSSIGVEQLSGPVGIAKAQFDILQTEHGWHRLLFFMVLLNVNLAIFNMLPLPVLDGGHITLAVLESIARRPVQARVLEVIQSVFVIALMGLALYVTTKDIGGIFGKGEKPEAPLTFPNDK